MRRGIDNVEAVPKKGFFVLDLRIIFALVLILSWTLVYDYFIFGNEGFFLIFNTINFISGLIADGILLVASGMFLVSFYALLNAYFLFMTDLHGFTKIERLFFEKPPFKHPLEFFSDLIHMNRLKSPPSPVPERLESVVLLLVGYYFLNLLEIVILSEIMFFTVSEAILDIQLTVENEMVLPILAASIPIGARVAALLGFEHAREYGNLVVESMFVFFLVGLVASLFGTGISTFLFQLTASGALGRFFAVALYLAMIPVVIEVSFWARRLM